MRKLKFFVTAVMLALVIGCAGVQRGCSSWSAESFGSDWIVVQYDMYLAPKACWKLNDVSITNEASSDGIYWVDSQTGHLIHISGWYDRVQVFGGRFEEAAKLVNVDIDLVQNGAYPRGK